MSTVADGSCLRAHTMQLQIRHLQCRKQLPQSHNQYMRRKVQQSRQLGSSTRAPTWCTPRITQGSQAMKCRELRSLACLGVLMDDLPEVFPAKKHLAF